MQFGPYTFKNIRSFMGHDGYGLSFDIYRSGHRFASYMDAGDGAPGDVMPCPGDGKPDASRLWDQVEEFKAYALAHAPRYMPCPEFDLPEHDGDVDYFAAAIASWADIEKLSRKYRKMGYGYTAVLMDNKVFPAAAYPIREDPDWEKVEDMFNHYAVKKTLAYPSFTIIPAGDVKFDDAFPEGSTFKE